jgi:hypothetical protein
LSETKFTESDLHASLLGDDAATFEKKSNANVREQKTFAPGNGGYCGEGR